MRVSAGLAIALACVSPAQGADWRMDPAASRLEFIATFEKASAPGVFKEFDTQLRFDPDHLARSSLDVRIRMASADMDSHDINQAIGGAQWFDASRHPQARFQATEIRPMQAAPAGRYVARGTLTLKGVMLPVDVPFDWRVSHSSNGHATMEGEFVLQRRAFGIGTGEWSATDTIGPDVRVKFRVQLKAQ